MTVGQSGAFVFVGQQEIHELTVLTCAPAVYLHKERRAPHHQDRTVGVGGKILRQERLSGAFCARPNRTRKMGIQEASLCQPPSSVVPVVWWLLTVTLLLSQLCTRKTRAHQNVL